MRPTMTSRFDRLLRAGLVLGSLVLAAPAAAQDIATAEALFNKGFDDMKAHRYETGCKALAESQRLDPRAGTLFTLATCEAEWGRIATAASRFGDYLALYDRLSDDKKAAQAERHKVATETRQSLLPEVPLLTLSLPKGAPAGTVVRRDGEVVAEAALGLSLPVDPGEHILTTQVPGGPVQELKITLAKGEKKVVTLEVAAANVGPAPTPTVPTVPAAPVVEPTSTGPSGRRVATYVVGGVGLAGLVVGAAMGGLAMAQKGVIDQHCGAGIGQEQNTNCDQSGFDAANGAKSAALGSTLGLAVGGALAATALVLFLTEPKATPPSAGAPATGRASRWLSAGVLSAGPAGAMLGARGAW